MLNYFLDLDTPASFNRAPNVPILMGASALGFGALLRLSVVLALPLSPLLSFLSGRLPRGADGRLSAAGRLLRGRLAFASVSVALSVAFLAERLAGRGSRSCGYCTIGRK